MSKVADQARVTVVLCDFANADAVGKLNLLGGGWAVNGVDPQTGSTPPMSIVVLIDTPPSTYGEDFTMTLTLVDSSGDPVAIAGPTGEMQAMGVGQVMRVETPQFPGTSIPAN